MRLPTIILTAAFPLFVHSSAFCPAVYSQNVKFSCVKNDLVISCNDTMEDGTVIAFTCIKDHYSDTDITKIITCINGAWDSPIPHCYSECGEEKGEARALSIGSKNVRRGEVPWHVGIYSLIFNFPNMTQICGGTIISPRIVVSAAHCFWNDKMNQAYPATLFEIAAGKIYREYNHEEDDGYFYVQRAVVKDIYIPKKYGGNELSFQADISLIVVENSFNFSQSVHSACMNLDDRMFDQEQLALGRIGKVSGWGLTESDGPSPVLKMVALPIVDFTVCQNTLPQSFRKYLTLDKLCVGYTNGTAACEGDSGGGFVFSAVEENRVRWYLRGIVSVGVKNDTQACSRDTYSGFTHLHKHSRWLKKIINNVENDVNTVNGCILPHIFNDGSYTVNDSRSFRPGSIVPPHTMVKYICYSDYSIHGDDSLICTSNGSWNGSGECIKMCGPLTSISLEYTCSLEGKEVTCTNLMKNGTMAIAQCKQGFFSKKIEPFYCNAGEWDTHSIPNCVNTGQCGKMNSSQTRLPWSAGIYRNNFFMVNPLCGGTILTTKTIISSAQCFWNNLDGMPIVVSSYGVIIGEFNDLPYQVLGGELLKIKDVKLLSGFKVEDISQHSNVAILILEEELTFSYNVNPVCFDLDDESFDSDQTTGRYIGKIGMWKNSVASRFGTVYGSGISRTAMSLVYGVETMVITPYRRCDKQSQSLDKLCGISHNYTILRCTPESEGSGLVFKNTNTDKWYLRGIVHVRASDLSSCNNGRFSHLTFTRIFKYPEIKKYIL